MKVESTEKPCISEPSAARPGVAAGVSVIIPMRNEERYIVACLQSLMNQISRGVLRDHRRGWQLQRPLG